MEVGGLHRGGECSAPWRRALCTVETGGLHLGDRGSAPRRRGLCAAACTTATLSPRTLPSLFSPLFNVCTAAVQRFEQGALSSRWSVSRRSKLSGQKAMFVVPIKLARPLQSTSA